MHDSAEKTSVSASSLHCNELLLLYGKQGIIVKPGVKPGVKPKAERRILSGFRQKGRLKRGRAGFFSNVAVRFLVETGAGAIV
jgi:hypothetical protein